MSQRTWHEKEQKHTQKNIYFALLKPFLFQVFKIFCASIQQFKIVIFHIVIIINWYIFLGAKTRSQIQEDINGNYYILFNSKVLILFQFYNFSNLMLYGAVLKLHDFESKIQYKLW